MIKMLRFKRKYLTLVNILLFAASAAVLLWISDYMGLLIQLRETSFEKFSYPLDTNFNQIMESLRKGEKPSKAPINEYPYRYKIMNSQKCMKRESVDYEKVDLLFIIKSALDHKSQRDAIRSSWGWESRFSDVVIRRVFILGTNPNDLEFQDEIDNESREQKDIVQADFTDSYYNNTIKTMMGYKWAYSHCPNTQYVMFCDDDMYISTKNLLRFIRDPLGQKINQKFPIFRDIKSIDSFFVEHFIAGYVFNSSSPKRFKFSKWYISLEEYPYSRYPPYVTAGAYVMNYNTLRDIYFASRYTKHFKFDDIYIGILIKKLGIEPFHSEHFYFWRPPYEKSAFKSIIASHGFGKPKELLFVWHEQRSFGGA